MKLLYTLIPAVLLAACNTAPQVVPDKTGDNIIVRKMEWQMQNHGNTNSWGWVLWYFPIVVLLFAWAWKEWVRPSINALENEDIDKLKENGVAPPKPEETQDQS